MTEIITKSPRETETFAEEKDASDQAVILIKEAGQIPFEILPNILTQMRRVASSTISLTIRDCKGERNLAGDFLKDDRIIDVLKHRSASLPPPFDRQPYS